MANTSDNTLDTSVDPATGKADSSWWSLIKRTAAAWAADYAPSMGAALPYYTVFSLAPVLVIVVAIAGLVFGEDAARGGIFAQISGQVGADAAATVEELLDAASQPSRSIPSAIIGFVVLFIGATPVFGELQDALDRIWRAPVRQGSSGLWGPMKRCLMAPSPACQRPSAPLACHGPTPG